MKSVFKISILIIGYALFFYSCEKESVEKSEETQQTIVKIINYEDIQNKNKIDEKLSDLYIARESSSSRIVYENNNLLDFIVLTDRVKYYEQGDYHTYTFPVYRENVLENIQENILVELQQNGEYKTYLVRYHLTEEEFTNLDSDISVLENTTVEYIFIENDELNINIESRVNCYIEYDIVATYTYNADCTCQYVTVSYENFWFSDGCSNNGGSGGYDSGSNGPNGGGGGSNGGSFGSGSTSPNNFLNPDGECETPPPGDLNRDCNINDIETLIINIDNCDVLTTRQKGWLMNNPEVTADIQNFISANGCLPNVVDGVVNLLANNNSINTFDDAFEEFYTIDPNFLTEFYEEDAPDIPIEDMAEYLECFDTNQGATLTIYVDQPTFGDNNMISGSLDVGHAFIGLQQGENNMSYGFYPASGAGLIEPTEGVMGNNSNANYNVSISLDITAQQLASIINYSINFADSEYDLIDNNCTDFAIGVGNFTILNLPEAITYVYVGAISNPGVLGEHIANMDIPSTPTGITVEATTSDYSPGNNKTCD